MPIDNHMKKHNEARFRIIFSDNKYLVRTSIAFDDLNKGMKALRDEIKRLRIKKNP